MSRWCSNQLSYAPVEAREFTHCVFRIQSIVVILRANPAVGTVEISVLAGKQVAGQLTGPSWYRWSASRPRHRGHVRYSAVVLAQCTGSGGQSDGVWNRCSAPAEGEVEHQYTPNPFSSTGHPAPGSGQTLVPSGRNQVTAYPWTSQYPYSADPVHPLPVPGLPLRLPEFPGTPGSPWPRVTALFGRGRIGVKELSPPKKRSVHFTQVGFIANHFPILFNGLDQAVKYSVSILLREKKMPGCLKAQF